MPKPSCLKCSNVATIAMYCARCYRNRSNEGVPALPAEKPRVLNAGPAQMPEPRVLNVCEADGCDTELPAQTGKGRRRKFCCAACRDRAYRAAG